jgi:hypothetical protein
MALAFAWVGFWSPTAHGQRANHTPEQLENVGLDQKLGTAIPTDLSFQNEQGKSVRLGQYFDGSTPVMLTLNYHQCPQLCRIQLQKFAESLSGMSWTAGDKFEVLTVDISPHEGPEMARKAQERLRHFAGAARRNAWGLALPDRGPGSHHRPHRLGGISLPAASGERPAVCPPRDDCFSERFRDHHTLLYHPQPGPGDLRTALVEASNGTVGSVVDKAFLACARFNPDSNSYSASAFKLMQYGSALMAIVMGAALFVFWRRENKQLDTVQEEGFEATLDERT